MDLKTVTNYLKRCKEFDGKIGLSESNRCRQVGHDNMISDVIRWRNTIAYRTKIGLFKMIGLTTICRWNRVQGRQTAYQITCSIATVFHSQVPISVSIRTDVVVFHIYGL